MNIAATTREYLVLRISSLKKGIEEMSYDNGTSLLIENIRIQECKNALTVLNGGKVPEFQKEVSNV